MTNTAKESGTDGFHILDLRTKKRRILGRETDGQPARASFCSPMSSEHFPIFSWDFDEGSETSQKKSRQEKSDSWLDYSCITSESELTGKSGREVCKPKKKKKRKLSPNEPDDDYGLGVPLSQGKTSSQPKAAGVGNGDWADGGISVKRKRNKGFVVKQDEATQVSAGPMKNRTDPTSSDKHEEARHSSSEDSLVELFTSSPCIMQHSSLPQKKAANKLATSTEVSSPIAPEKPHKHKKSGVENSDSTSVRSRKPHKEKTFSVVEDFDCIDVTSQKPHKHKKSSGVEDANCTDVTPQKPHKHKKPSGVKESDSINVTPRKPHKHKKNSGVEDSDSADVTPRKPHKHKKISGVEDSDSADVTPRKPQKHKIFSDAEDCDCIDVTSRKPHKHKKSSGVEDSNNADVTSRKPHVDKTFSSMEDSDCINVKSKKPHKHKKSSGVEDSDSTNVTSRKTHKHKIFSGMEDSNSTNVTPQKPHKHKKSSGVEESDSTDVTPRKPHKHKKNSGMEDSDSTDVIRRKPHKHKKPSGVEESDSVDGIPKKPHKHKKPSGVEESDSADGIPKKPHKHKKPSGVEESDSADGIPKKPYKHKKSSGVEDSDSTNVSSRKPHVEKTFSGVEESGSIDVASRKPHKHKTFSVVEDSNSTDVTPQKPHKHKKSSGVEESGGTDVTHRKPHKHKKTSRVKESDSSNVGFEVEETDRDLIKNKSQAKHLPLKPSRALSKIPKDVGKSSSKELPASQSFFIEANEFLDASKVVLPDLETATKELEEFIPHVRNLSASAVRQLALRDLVRFKNFKQRGIAVKFGKFTKMENNQLRENVEAFLQVSGIESAEKLLFTHRFPEERTAINNLKAKHLFGIRIAEGIPRPWRLVYYRARKMLDPSNYNGRYSAKEKRKLLEYQAMYGNDWKKISELMSRSSHSLQLKFSEIKCEPRRGPWSKEETQRLIRAVEEMLQAKCKETDSDLEEKSEGKALSVLREDLYKGISWMKVETKVGTRHWRQCKQKWIQVVTKRMSRGQMKTRGNQNLQFKINLIERLYELNIKEAHEVDWEVLSSLIGDVPPHYIQGRFYRLKATNVPFWYKKTFPEIIDHLYEVTLPKLNALLKVKKTNVQSTPVKEQRKVFQFQEIFWESDDELIDESDESDESEDELKAEGSVDGSESC